MEKIKVNQENEPIVRGYANSNLKVQADGPERNKKIIFILFY